MDDKLLILAEVVGKLKAQVKELSSTTAEVSKQEGPQGVQGPVGATGKQGPKGEQGERGADGVDGKDGTDGEQGVSVVDGYIAADNSLVLKLSNGNEIDTGSFFDSFGNNSTYVSNTQAGFDPSTLPFSTSSTTPTEIIVKQNNAWVRTSWSTFTSWLGTIATPGVTVNSELITVNGATVYVNGA